MKRVSVKLKRVLRGVHADTAEIAWAAYNRKICALDFLSLRMKLRRKTRSNRVGPRQSQTPCVKLAVAAREANKQNTVKSSRSQTNRRLGSAISAVWRS